MNKILIHKSKNIKWFSLVVQRVVEAYFIIIISTKNIILAQNII